MSNRVKIAGACITLVTASLLAGIHLWEGSKAVPYRDLGGIWTVCAGITGPKVIPGKTYTPAECEALETEAVEEHGRGVAACIKVPISQKTYEGLALFAYNVGVWNACTSTAVRKINAGDLAGGCQALHMWDKVGTNVVRGLQRRRAFEYAWCMGGVQ